MSSSPSPSSLRIALSCWRSMNSRCCLSIPSLTSLRIVSAIWSSLRWLRAHEWMASTRSPTSTACSIRRRSSSLNSAHSATASASWPGALIVRSSSGSRRDRRSSAINSNVARSSRVAASTLDDTIPSMTGSTTAKVAAPAVISVDVTRARRSTWTIAAVSPVGRLPTLGTRATTARLRSSPPVSAMRPSVASTAASTARRRSSVARVKVTVAPGRTAAGRWARGRRVVVVDCSVACSVMLTRYGHQR